MTKFDTENVLHSRDGITSPVCVTPGDSDVTVSLHMSYQSLTTLDQLAKAGGTTLGDVISKAFILYEASADASRQGKAVGIAANPDVLETEFVGF